MVEYERILLPVAGNGDVDRVVEHARTLAESVGADLVALDVLDPDADEDAGADGDTGTLDDPLSADAVFDAVAERVGDAVSLERVTATGDPGTVIVEQVHEQDCDFVVMGTHNRQGLDRLVTGS
ncbi:MAG: universal stress protein, partial [Halobaculum sp.]